ncbi:hypothetical protein CIB48_g195 [Xylaria polymorpha]|nr:hypothetical protein CIB48_g195 [Xylaria polymorpha]
MWREASIGGGYDMDFKWTRQHYSGDFNSTEDKVLTMLVPRRARTLHRRHLLIGPAHPSRPSTLNLIVSPDPPGISLADGAVLRPDSSIAVPQGHQNPASVRTEISAGDSLPDLNSFLSLSLLFLIYPITKDEASPSSALRFGDKVAIP